jgi:2-dehydropantoate 2-reductase
MQTPRIAIIGAGAIGSYFGSGMLRAGLDVTLFDPWAEHVAHVRAHGLKVAAMPPEAPVTTRPDLRGIGEVQALVRERPVDVACIAVKSYDTTWATDLILPYLAQDGVLVSLQNSFNEPEIARIAGAGRTFGVAINALACDLTEPGMVQRNSPVGYLDIGAMEPGQTARRDTLIELFAGVEKARAVDDLAAAKWSKLVINSMRNGLSAMTGMTGAERDTTDLTIAIGIRLGAQAVRVGRAMGLALVDTAYSFDALVAADEGCADATATIRARMAEIANGRSSEQRPSMAQDIRKGRRTETDAINGLVARRGRELGVETGLHQRVHNRIREIERGAATPAPALAEGLL